MQEASLDSDFYMFQIKAVEHLENEEPLAALPMLNTTAKPLSEPADKDTATTPATSEHDVEERLSSDIKGGKLLDDTSTSESSKRSRSKDKLSPSHRKRGVWPSSCSPLKLIKRNLRMRNPSNVVHLDIADPRTKRSTLWTRKILGLKKYCSSYCKYIRATFRLNFSPAFDWISRSTICYLSVSFVADPSCTSKTLSHDHHSCKGVLPLL